MMEGERALGELAHLLSVNLTAVRRRCKVHIRSRPCTSLVAGWRCMGPADLRDSIIFQQPHVPLLWGCVSVLSLVWRLVGGHQWLLLEGYLFLIDMSKLLVRCHPLRFFRVYFHGEVTTFVLFSLKDVKAQHFFGLVDSPKQLG